MEIENCYIKAKAHNKIIIDKEFNCVNFLIMTVILYIHADKYKFGCSYFFLISVESLLRIIFPKCNCLKEMSWHF